MADGIADHAMDAQVLVGSARRFASRLAVGIQAMDPWQSNLHGVNPVASAVDRSGASVRHRFGMATFSRNFCSNARRVHRRVMRAAIQTG